jgi:glycosyltransferase involved in cell wall biosynthesis
MVSFYFHPNYSGSAVQALNLCHHLQRRGLAPLIVSANLSGSAPFEEYQGVPLHRLAVARHRDLQIPAFWLSLSRFLRSRRREIDIVHAHGTVQHGAASLAGRLLGIPSILKVAMANSDLAFDRRGRLRGPVDRFMVARFDRYIATTAAIAREFGDRGLDARRVVLIPNGVDTDVHRPASTEERAALRQSLGLPDGPLVAYVGIVNARKNVDGILRIWAGAVGRGAPGHLLLVGPLPDAGEADPFVIAQRAFLADRGLASRVTFVGRRPEAAPYLRASDVFLFPSRQEGMPNSVLEAMACGLPCLVSTGAGIDDVMAHDDTGLQFPLTDESAFAGALTALLGDEAARARLGGAARRHIVDRYSLGAIADRYVELYTSLLS